MKHLTPAEAFLFLKENSKAILIDCRSEIEFHYVGHPIGAMQIAWNDGPNWEINPNFASEVTWFLSGDKSRPVILICRSGHRSVDAANVLIANGFIDVYNILEGFEGDLDSSNHRGTLGGWRKAGLPWEQS